MIPTAKDFENELIGILREAQQRKESHVDVDAGTLHRQIGDIQMMEIIVCQCVVMP